jgi:hypothetical protein
MTDLLPEARRVLDLARLERTPSEAHRAYMQQRIARSLGVAALVAGAGSAASAAAAVETTLLAKHAVALKLGVIGLCAATAVLSYPLLRSEPPAPRAAVEQSGITAAAAAAPEPARPAPTLPIAAIEGTPEPASPAPEPTPQPRTRAPANSQDALARELDLLHAAQAAWREGSARKTLELVRAHSARFPGSSLALERDALHVLALCQLNRHRAARSLAARWLKRFGHSPLRTAIEQSCALR